MKKYILFSLSLIAIAAYAVEPQIHVISACVDSPAITLKSSCSTADSYVWTDSVSTTDSYSFNPIAEGQFTFGVHAFGTQIDTANNLMINGSFESGYSGFESEFDAIKKNNQKILDPKDVYKNYTGGDYGHYYAITSDASRFWDGYYAIKPHSGKYFMVVDASSQKYVWKATTTQGNPSLTIEKNKTYLFSCWTAYPNTGKELKDPVAKLQFSITYLDASLTKVTKDLGKEFSVLDPQPSEMYKWHQHYVVWTAPETSSYVEIGVKDKESSTEGNDFCLDDIVFQPVNSAIVELAVDSFVINVEDCSCIPLYSMWNDVLFVDNYDSLYTSYQWYHNGAAISGATMQYYRLPSTGDNDTYQCVMQDANGVSYETCESSFSGAKVSSNYPEGDHGSKAPVARRLRYQFGQLVVEEITYDDGSVEYRKTIQL